MTHKAYLFVYGTLMVNFNHRLKAFILENGAHIGNIQLPGVLYDLGRYPGFKYQEGTAYTVKGNIYELHTPDETFAVLDKFEGIIPTLPPELNEYIRRQIVISFQEQSLSLSFYEYNGNTKGLTLIPEGDYPTYAAQNPNHQHFIQSI